MDDSSLSILKNSDILIIDDTPANLLLLANMLNTRGCRVRPVPSGQLAFKVIEKEIPDLILLDINMPEMNGYQVCRKLKADKRFSDIPVIFMSALNEMSDKVEAFNCGGLDYITKPFQVEEVEARVKTHLRLRHYQVSLEELVKEQVAEISDSQISTIFALSKLAESRDTDTGKHLERVKMFCGILAERISKEPPYRSLIDSKFLYDIENASSLHDIGKIAIADSILLKPGKLTSQEFETMKTHTTIGAQTMEEVKLHYPGNSYINIGILIARSHHERWDGCGYPDGLAGENIPLVARIMAVVDVYDATRSKRCYKEPMTHSESCELISKGRGTQFDPLLVEAFMDISDEFERIGLDMGLL